MNKRWLTICCLLTLLPTPVVAESDSPVVSYVRYEHAGAVHFGILDGANNFQLEKGLFPLSRVTDKRVALKTSLKHKRQIMFLA